MVVVQHVPAAIETDETDAKTRLRGDDLGEQQPGLVGEELAGLDAERDVEVAEVTRDDARVGVQVEGPLAGVQWRAEAAADVDLGEGQSAARSRRTMRAAAATAASNTADRRSASRWRGGNGRCRW